MQTKNWESCIVIPNWIRRPIFKRSESCPWQSSVTSRSERETFVALFLMGFDAWFIDFLFLPSFSTIPYPVVYMIERPPHMEGRLSSSSIQFSSHFLPPSHGRQLAAVLPSSFRPTLMSARILFTERSHYVCLRVIVVVLVAKAMAHSRNLKNDTKASSRRRKWEFKRQAGESCGFSLPYGHAHSELQRKHTDVIQRIL